MQKTVPYAKAIDAKYPEQVVIAIARAAGGVCNPITLGWTMITSHEPPMMAVSIGLGRYSLEVFRRAKEFVVAMPSEDQADETMLFGTRSGRDMDKFVAAGTVLEDASEIDCVIMSDATANFECRLVGEMETGDHRIFVGEVVCSHVHPDMPSRLYTAGAGYKMSGIARLG